MTNHLRTSIYLFCTTFRAMGWHAICYTKPNMGGGGEGETQSVYCVTLSVDTKHLLGHCTTALICPISICIFVVWIFSQFFFHPVLSVSVVHWPTFSVVNVSITATDGTGIILNTIYTRNKSFMSDVLCIYTLIYTTI